MAAVASSYASMDHGGGYQHHVNSTSGGAERTAANASSPRSVDSGSTSSISHTAPSSGLGAYLPNPTEDQLAGRTYLEYIRSWGDSDVAKWLADNRCSAHAATFASNDIRGNVILDIDQSALKEMGVSSVGDRIKITVAVKKLRQACMASREQQIISSRRTPAAHPQGSSGFPVRSNSLRRPGVSVTAIEPGSPTFPLRSPAYAVVTPAQLGRRSSVGKATYKVPPPLHLSSSAVSDARLPQAYQPGSNAVNPPSAVPISILPNLPSLPSNETLRSRSPRSGEQALPAVPNASPQMQASLNALRPSSKRTHYQQHLVAPSQSTVPSPSSGDSNRSAYQSDIASHRKMASGTSTIGAHPYASAYYQRPSTTQSAAGYASSPSTESIASTSSGGSARAGARPGTAPTHITGRSFRTEGASLGLSPIFEASTASTAPVSLEPGQWLNTSNATLSPMTKPQIQNQAFSVLKSSFGRPSTSTGTVSVTAVGVGGAGQAIPLEDVMRKTVKFIGDDGVSKMVNVEGSRDANEIMLRILRKFGKLGIRDWPNIDKNRPRNEQGDPYAEVEGWAIYSALNDGSLRPLTETELMNICRSTTRPERARGLYLRRRNSLAQAADEARVIKAKKLRNFFGEDPKAVVSPTSPTGMLNGAMGTQQATDSLCPMPMSPSPEDLAGAPTPPQKSRQQLRDTLHRASTAGLLTGLNRLSLGGVGSQAQTRSQTTSFLNNQKLKSFFGQRPPSELITSHLVDFFPNAERDKKHMSKAVKHQVRKSMLRRESTYGVGMLGKTSWDASRDSQSLAPGLSLSRFSVSSAGSDPRASIDTIPPLPSKNLAMQFQQDSRPHVLSRRSTSSSVAPSISIDSDEEDDDSYMDRQSIASQATRKTSRTRPSSRLSAWSNAKSNRDSDAASVLTVEEITEDLQKRRASRFSIEAEASELVSADETGQDSLAATAASNPLEPALKLSSTTTIAEEDEDVDQMNSESDEEQSASTEDDEEDEVEQNEKDLDVPVAVTTKAKKSTFRWVKGALIGAGAFGEVYLGMNAANGSFMAVKQVELPTGDSRNEARKKSMLTALEREIELLKVMSHDNIVQYLDSNSDGQHLFIFLEYVPGGSVAHLLATLGAFEETLVRTFVRQILAGLVYLHENDIIHRDIKGANILVDNRGVVKISDFGISKKVEDGLLAPSQSRMHRPSLQGSVFWMAPEVVKQTSHTAKADIWSLGCLIVEMRTGQHPWMELTQMQAIFKIGSAPDARPSVPSGFSDVGQAFLDLTFRMNHLERPTAKVLSQHDFATRDLETDD